MYYFMSIAQNILHVCRTKKWWQRMSTRQHFLQLFHFPQFDFNLWIIQLCRVVSQLALSDPPAWVQTSHLCPLTWPAPLLHHLAHYHGLLPRPSASPTFNEASILLGFPETSPWAIISLLTLIFGPGVGFAPWCF